MSTQKRIASLDGLRAFSIVAVIIGHLAGTGSVTWAAILAGVGVNVFFVISGFLITTLLQQEHERTGAVSLGAFYWRRCFRIFPAALAFVVITALAIPSVRPALAYALTYSVSYFFQSTPEPWRHLWSLSVEEQFYLLWPVAFVLWFKRRAGIAWAAVGAAVLWRLGVGLGHASGTSYIDATHYLFFGSMDSLAAGCLLAIYADRLRECCDWLVESTAVVIALPVISFILYAALWGGPEGIANRIVLPLLWPAFCFSLAAWVFLVTQRKDWIFNNWLAVRIGWLSYSLYLWQQPLTTSHIKPIIAIPALAACALASYFLIEQPMIAYGKNAGGRIASKFRPPLGAEKATAV